ncbi:MAG: sulfate permease [Ginsengibacter sp.]|jgi:SulP family sulfate permease
MFRPKIFDTLKTYNRKQFSKDVMAGIIVGIVALPLAIAFAIASGVGPEKGLITAVIAGFIVSAMGGSRVQIGGPTGAFIVIVYGIVQMYGVNGLIIATLMAGVMLIIMGFARLGAVIKFIPHSLIIGFTSGIAVIIFSSQIKDFFGLTMGAVPADFLEKWRDYFLNLQSINIYAAVIGILTIAIIMLWPRITQKVPGSLVAILAATVAVQVFHIPVETIGSRFGDISSSFPAPSIPYVDWAIIQNLMLPAFTIAMLCAIESLLSAVVADGMIGGNHKSNMELVAQGTANVFSALFGGIPATGAIARTATNVKNGGRTPVAGIVHAITLLIILLFVGKWASYIPLANLAGILVVIAYNMSEWRNFRSILKGPKGDIAVMVITFLLTVLIDLTVAIQIGMVLAVFLFMRKMIRTSNVSVFAQEDIEDNEFGYDLVDGEYQVPKDVEVFEIIGPLFFGSAFKFKDAMRYIKKHPKILIIRMRHVPMIDATGIQTLKDVIEQASKEHTKIILSEVHSEQVRLELEKVRLIFAIGKANITDTFEEALVRTNDILSDEFYLNLGK